MKYTLDASLKFSLLHFSRSQFYLTFKATPHLDKKHTVFGKLVGGEDVLDALEALPVKSGTERPAKPIRITEVIMCVVWSLSFNFIWCLNDLCASDIKIPLTTTKPLNRKSLRGKRNRKRKLGFAKWTL